jgi:hypothetical protein
MHQQPAKDDLSARLYPLVDDVEELADFLRRFSLDHVGNGLASDVAVERLCTEISIVKAVEFEETSE